MVVRPARLDDYPAIAAFDTFIGDRRLDLQTGSLFVSEAGATLCGYAALQPGGFFGWPYLAYLCVDPRFHRQGHGRALVEHAMADPRFARLYVSTEASNSPARALFAACSATPIGHVDELNMDGDREVLFRLK